MDAFKLLVFIVLFLPFGVLSLIVWVFGGWTDKYRYYPLDWLYDRTLR